jgi:2-polyprenyl-3-methyl-5-hydroxy-6-metoxy-1,4-benzoquinol methylase
MHEHALTASAIPLYDRCVKCSSLFRTTCVDPEMVYGGRYWDRAGYSTLEEQVYNVSAWKNETGITKIDAVMKYCPGGESAMEIGCAPGALLRELHKRYRNVTGIEYDHTYRARISNIVQGDAALVFGVFPRVAGAYPASLYDCIVGMDILEHVEDGRAFIDEVYRLLKPHGRAVLMMPMVCPDGLFDKKNYHPEHAALYSTGYLRVWFEEIFDAVQLDRWIVGHEIVAMTKDGISE